MCTGFSMFLIVMVHVLFMLVSLEHNSKVCSSTSRFPIRDWAPFEFLSYRFFAALVFPAKTHFVKAKKAFAMLSKNSG